MVRAPAHALPRSNGFALLRPASRPQLDANRILTLSGTLAINLLAAGLLMMPLSIPLTPPVQPDEKPQLTLHDVFRDPPIVDVVPVTRPATPTPATRPIERLTVAPPQAEATSSAVTSETGTDVVVVAATGEDAGPAASLDVVAAGPSPMQLEYRLAPAPAYPRRALQQRLAGTVLLQVLVGIDGRPLEVKVAQSSGHRELDEAARAQVLKRWSFQPASRNGQAVQAIGMVPIEFALQR
jgi:protein TonB